MLLEAGKAGQDGAVEKEDWEGKTVQALVGGSPPGLCRHPEREEE